MTENKTQPTGASVQQFISSVEDEEQRRDCRALQKMMQAATGEKAAMWGDSLLGFGRYHYRYASGREGDFLLTGFSPRKGKLSIYIMPGFDRYQEQLARLGKYKIGRACLYIKSLAAVDLEVLREIVHDSVRVMRETYPD